MIRSDSTVPVFILVTYKQLHVHSVMQSYLSAEMKRSRGPEIFVSLHMATNENILWTGTS